MCVCVCEEIDGEREREKKERDKSSAILKLKMAENVHDSECLPDVFSKVLLFIVVELYFLFKLSYDTLLSHVKQWR